jgi:hypothetical protein
MMEKVGGSLKQGKTGRGIQVDENETRKGSL